MEKIEKQSIGKFFVFCHLSVRYISKKFHLCLSQSRYFFSEKNAD